MKKISSLFVKGISVLPALLVMPAMATYTWDHPDVDSYTTINGDINYTATTNSSVITGTAMRNVVNGDVNLIVEGINQDNDGIETNVYGSLFLPSTGALLSTETLGAPAPSDEAKSLQQWINGDVNVLIKDSTIAKSVVGVNFYKSDTELTESGLSGKTTVTVDNSTVNESVRGTNYRDIGSTNPKAKVGDIELNINNSLIKEEIVSAGSYASAGNVVINVTGNSVVGYTDYDAQTRTLQSNGEEADGWIIAGANRVGASIASTVVNLNTNGTIKFAGDVNAGSRERSSNNTNENSVIGDATLNMLGGGNILIGGDVRAYHVGGAKTLNLSNINATVGGAVKEFQTINMDENSTLTAGALTMTSSDTLNVVLQDSDAYSKINVGQLDANGAKLNMTVRSTGDYNVVNATTTTTDFTYNLENALYDLTNNNGRISVTAKSASDIANNTGITIETANMMSALAQSNDDAANQMSLAIQESLANGDIDYVEHEVSKMNPEKAPVTTSVALSVQNQVLAAAGERMALPLTGRSGGDIQADLGVWAKGMYNYTKQKNTFTGNTWGGSVGIDTDLNHSVILGAGYSFGITNVDLNSYDADINSNTLFVYGQYRNSDWFVNGTIAYTMSKYELSKAVFGVHTDPSYNVNSLSEQIMGGYHFANGITPTLGLRYLDVHQDAYQDGIVSVNDVYSKYLTGVVGMDFKNAWVAPHTSVFWNPELHLAATYDMVSDPDVALVMVPGSAAYTVETDSLSRLGGEIGIGLTAEYYYLTVSLNYDLTIHKDFSSQTGSLKVKYKF